MGNGFLVYQGNIRLKMRAFWDIPLCSLVGVDRCFRGAYCSIIRVMNPVIPLIKEAVHTSETLVHSNETT
jgi:hypothetical protein